MRHLRKTVRADAYGVDCLLQPCALVAPDVAALKSGGLLAAWRYEGIDYGAHAPEIAAIMRNHLGQHLDHGSGWVIETNVFRRKVSAYPTWGEFPDPLSALIEHERRTYFERGRYRETQKYMSLSFFPPSETEERVRGWFYEDGTGEPDRGLAALALERFQETVTRWEKICAATFTMERLGECVFSDSLGGQHAGSNLLRYIRYAAGGKDRPFLLPPDNSIDLDTLIPTGRLTPGMSPYLDGQHLRVIAVEAFPGLLFPCATRALEDLPFDFRFHTRANLLSREEAQAIYKATSIRHGSRVRSFVSKLLHKNPKPNEQVNERAVDLRADAQAALKASDHPDEHTALLAAHIILLREDMDELNRDTVQIETTLDETSHLGIRIEDENAVDAWNGTLPGHAHYNMRRWPLRSYNVASLMPIHSVWTGHEYSPHPKLPPKSPPLMVTMTTGNTPYRHNLYISDVGHTTCIGPTGNGKTTLEGLHAVSQLRYPGARVIFFDRRRTKYVLVKALGGDFYDYAAANAPAHCPLQYLDDEGDRAWAVGYIETLCVLNKLVITAEHRSRIADGIERFRAWGDRSLTHFLAAVRSAEIREALQLYTHANASSRGVLDALKDTSSTARVCAYEMQHLYDLHPAVCTAVQLHQFRRVVRSCSTDHPTSIFVDEAGELVSDPFVARQLESYLIGLRNAHGFVWLSFQAIHQIASSTISTIIKEQCKGEFLLPNAKAGESEVKRQYEAWGLNEAQIARIQRGISKQDYFWRTAEQEQDRDSTLAYKGGRFVQMRLELNPVALSFIGANSDADRALCDSLIARHGNQWQAEWLRAKGFHGWAEYYEKLVLDRMELEEVVA